MIPRKKKYNPPEVCETAVVMLERSFVASYVVEVDEMIAIEGQQVDGFYEDANLTFDWSWE